MGFTAFLTIEKEGEVRIELQKHEEQEIEEIQLFYPIVWKKNSSHLDKFLTLSNFSKFLHEKMHLF